MTNGPIIGQTVRWRYEDGPMKGKRFEHRFSTDGTVSWRELADGDAGREAAPAADSTAHYQAATIGDGVAAVAYLSGSGWTLTTVVNTKDRSVVSFASNEKQLVVQHGKLETA